MRTGRAGPDALRLSTGSLRSSSRKPRPLTVEELFKGSQHSVLVYYYCWRVIAQRFDMFTQVIYSLFSCAAHSAGIGKSISRGLGNHYFRAGSSSYVATRLEKAPSPW